MDEKPLHLVVRFSDTIFGVGDVVAKHNTITLKYGTVWSGKMGSTLVQRRIESHQLNISNCGTLVLSSSGYFLVCENKSIF
jgi:hypothetical protein